MILYQWRGPQRNFGDELNSLLWPRLLPDFFDREPDRLFLGIGSVLDSRHDPRVTKIVAGSGYGGYEAMATLDPTWIVHWVRGPRSAFHMRLPASLGFGDPASLLPLVGLDPPREARNIGFMPHFESAAKGAWQEAAAAAGLTMIDPRDDPEAILTAIGQCRCILSEALHGVIVADALRVPWIALQPLAPIHRSKWFDWAATLELTIPFRTLRPSTALERAHLSGLSHYHKGRTLLERHGARLLGLARQHHIDQAAKALRDAAQAEPILSPDTPLDRSRTRMMEAIAVLRRDPGRGWRPGIPGSELLTPKALHTGALSA